MANVIIGSVLVFLGGSIGIIYATLNKGVNDNKEDIKRGNEKYVTKDDFNRHNDKTDGKLDKILDIVMELKMGGHNEK